MTASSCAWNCPSLHWRLCYPFGLFDPNSQASQFPKGSGFGWLYSTGLPEVPRHVLITLALNPHTLLPKLDFPIFSIGRDLWEEWELDLQDVLLGMGFKAWLWLAREWELGAAWLVSFWSNLCVLAAEMPPETSANSHLVTARPGTPMKQDKKTWRTLLLRCLKYTPIRVSFLGVKHCSIQISPLKMQMLEK